jgi:flagellar FliJ protein
MKRFRFSLRPVAVLRAHRELQAREAFGVAVGALAAAERALAATVARLRELEAMGVASRRDRFRAGEATAFQHAYQRACANAAETEQRVVAARAELQRRRAEYLEAYRQMKVVTRLEEKARGAHRREIARLEQLELDEIASLRAGRLPVLA